MRRFLTVVLLASLVLWMPQSTVLGSNHLPSVPRADVEATALRIVGPDPMWVDGEPTDTTIEVDFTNRGTMDSSAYTVQYSWVDAAGTVTALNGGATYAGSTEDGPPVDQGDTVSDPTVWNLQPEQTGQGAIRVTIDQDGRTTDMDFPQFVPDHRVTYSLEGEAQEIRPDETRFFRVVATNEGNVAQAVTLRLTDADEGDNARLEAEWDMEQLTVPPGSSREATLFLTYPQRGDTEPFNASLTINASKPLGSPVQLQTPPITLGTVGPGGHTGYEFTLAQPTQTVFAGPGETKQVRLGLSNTAQSSDGNLSDTYRVTAQATGGWSATVRHPRMALEEQASDFVVILLEPPSQAVPGTAAVLDVEVVSDHDDPGQPQFPAHRLVPLRVSGPAMAIASIEVVPSPLYRGDAPQVAVTLANEGDVDAPGGTLRVTATAASQDVDGEVTVESFSAGRSATRRVPLASMDTGGEVTIEAEWVPAAGHPDVLPARRQAQLFLHDPDFLLSPAQALDGVPGADVRYAASPHAFTIQNTGNAAETVVLTATVQEGAVRLLGDDTLRLEPGDVRTIPLVQSLPTPTGDLLPRSVAVSASIQGRPGMTWSASTDTAIDDTQSPLLLPDPAPAEWLRTASLPLRAVVTDETAVASVALRITAPNGSVAVRDLQRSTGDGWAGDHRFSADGNHTLVFTATDAAGNVATGDPHVVRVGSIPPPELELVSVQAGDTAPWNGSFSVAVHDARAVESVLVSVSGAGGAQEFPVANGRALVRLAELPSRVPGNVTLLLQATNAAGASTSMELDLVLLEPEPVQDKEIDRSRGHWTPAPSALLAALAVVLVAIVRRRALR